MRITSDNTSEVACSVVVCIMPSGYLLFVNNAIELLCTLVGGLGVRLLLV